MLDAPLAAEYGGLQGIAFKHQGFNPTGSFKDNGMTCGVAQALRLGMRRVACVSTGNTSASMAAYAAAAGIEALIFLPHGNISFGKLAQALEYGAKTLEVDANFDQILALVRDPRRAAGNLSAELHQSLPHRGPEEHHVRNARPARLARAGLGGAAGRESGQRLGVRQGAARSPGCRADRSSAASGRDSGRRLRALLRIRRCRPARANFIRWRSRRRSPPRSGSAIPCHGPRRCTRFDPSDGVVEKVSEQEIADAKAIIGRCGIGCEPASAATLAGIRKLTASGRDRSRRGRGRRAHRKRAQGSGLHLSVPHGQRWKLRAE